LAPTLLNIYIIKINSDTVLNTLLFAHNHVHFSDWKGYEV